MCYKKLEYDTNDPIKGEAMKRIFSLLIAIVLLASALSLRASKAQAAGLITFVDGRFIWGKGIVFQFDAFDVKNKDLKGANIFAGSDYHKMYCSYNDDTEKIVCVVGGGLTEFAGQTGVIYLAGQIFYVTIPNMGLPPGVSDTNPDESCDGPDEEGCEDPGGPAEPGNPGDPGDPGDPPPACIPPEVLGADVDFVDGEDVVTQLFVPGASLAEVSANAAQMLFGGEGWEDFQIVSPLGCGMSPQ
jgi:hypothetical protein